MTALAANRNLQLVCRGTPEITEYQVAAGVHIYKGAIVGLTGLGYARPCRSCTAGLTTVMIPFDKAVGIAVEEADNSSGAAGAIRVQVYPGGTFIRHPLASVAIGDVGCQVYVTDDGTLSKLAVGKYPFGRVRDLDTSFSGVTGQAIIEIDPGFRNGLPWHTIAPLSVIAANYAALLHPLDNSGGMMVDLCAGIVTTAHAGTEDQGLTTVFYADADFSSNEVTTGLVLTPADGGAAANTALATTLGKQLSGDGFAANDLSAVSRVTIPAGKAGVLKVSQPTTGSAAGAVKVFARFAPFL